MINLMHFRDNLFSNKNNTDSQLKRMTIAIADFRPDNPYLNSQIEKLAWESTKNKPVRVLVIDSVV